MVSVLLVTRQIAEGILSGSCPRCLGFLFFVNPLSETFFEVVAFGGAGFFVYFALQFALIVGLLVLMAYTQGAATYRAIRLPLDRISDKLRSKSALVVVGQVFMALIFFDTLYFLLILPSIGIEPVLPDFFQQAPEWYVLYSLVDASIWEEIAVRVLFIGLPLMLGSLLVRLTRASSTPPQGSGSKSRHLLGSLKYLLGGQVNRKSPKPVQITAAVLLFFSAVLFGYLHVISWGALWKFVDTFVGGLALGYLFLRKGIAASILLHFAINAQTVLLTVLGGETNLGALVVLVLISLAFAVFGLGYFLFYAKGVGGFLFGRALKRPKEVGEPKEGDGVRRPVTTGPPLYPVVCRKCGGQEAVYKEGVLICATCGERL